NRTDRKIVFYHNKVIVQDDKYSTLLTQMMSGLQEIKTFNMVSKLKAKLNLIQNRFTKMYGIKRDYFTTRDNDVEIITYTFRFLLYVLLIYLLGIGKVDVSILVLMISYHESLVSYINKLISSTSVIRETNISVNRVNDILNYSSESIGYGNLDTNDIYGNIEFKNVSLTIKNKQVLKDINLKVDHNEVVAIVGETGSGKSMIFNLLLRLWKPTSGKITLDNINIYDFSKKVYTQNVSIANQKPFIFNMSIRKNLDFVDEDIENQKEACKKAGIHDFIESLPNGYQTILRENGSNISGGQKQMISIARTILSDAEVLLLDDITTSLDPDTAKLVPKLIDNLKKDHTIIMITKKPDLMKQADKIVILDKGSIVAVGTHQKLLETNEIYQVLQSRKSPSRIGVFDND
ncbi:MAG: ABC transporter ATP-binding protein, partial [Firmicutes bacterium]|nr:ABC transporter ATP-binding protein [Bacillota bacterium]